MERNTSVASMEYIQMPSEFTERCKLQRHIEAIVLKIPHDSQMADMRPLKNQKRARTADTSISLYSSSRREHKEFIHV